MKNIWKIFTGDLKKLVKHPFALVIIIGLCVIPSLYAWFNIFANWDPYANTGGIPVAVVSLDQDYTLKDGSVVNMGESVLESLHSNTSVKWIFLDTEEEAKEGVEAGKYYAAIVITDKFTYSMYNVFSDDFENPALIYYQNQKSNAIATKITDTVAGTLQNTINETFIKVAATTVFEEGNTVSDQVQGDSYVEEFCSKLEELNDNLKEYSAMIDSFQAGNARLESAITHVNYEIPAMQKKLDSTTASLNQSSQDLSSTRDTLGNFSNNIDTSMSNINNSLESIKKALDESKLAEDTAQMTRDLNRVARDTNTLNGQVNTLLAALIQQKLESVSDGNAANGGTGSNINAAATDAAMEALKAMQKLTSENVVDMEYYTFKEIPFAGIDKVIFSTTGYTGSGGCEVYAYNKDAEKLWNAVFEAGAEFGIQPIGLGARDTLRLEAGFCLYGHEIDDDHSPIEAGLGWITKFVPGNDFIMREYHEKLKADKPTRYMKPFEIIDRGIARQGYPIEDAEGNEIGVVCSGTVSPLTGKSIGTGYVKSGFHKLDSEIFIRVRNKALKAKIVKTPFF